MDSEALRGTLKRTQILLPATMKVQGQKLAEIEGISLGELIRQALGHAIEGSGKLGHHQEAAMQPPEVIPGSTDPHCPECPHLLDDHGLHGCLDPDCYCELAEGSTERSGSTEPRFEVADPVVTPRGSMCGLCDSMAGCSHPELRCVACGGVGLAENMPKMHTAEACSAQRRRGSWVAAMKSSDEDAERHWLCTNSDCGRRWPAAAEGTECPECGGQIVTETPTEPRNA